MNVAVMTWTVSAVGETGIIGLPEVKRVPVRTGPRRMSGWPETTETGWLAPVELIGYHDPPLLEEEPTIDRRRVPSRLAGPHCARLVNGHNASRRGHKG